MENLKAQVKGLIANNKTEKAFRLLFEIIEANGLQEYKNDLILIQSKYNNLKKEDRLFLAERNDISLDYNKLNNSLLETVDVIFEFIDNGERGKEKAIPDPSNGQKKNNLILRILMVLGGALLIFIVFKFVSGQSSDTPSPVTIIVKSKNNIPLPEKGEVLLNYGGAQLVKNINNNNEAIFTEVPADYFQQDSKVKIRFQDPQGEPYHAVFPDSIYQLKKNSTIELLVALSGLEGIFGVVKDAETGKYLEGVRVSILDVDTYSNENGWFELKLPEEKQQKFHTMRAELAGYLPWEKQNIPLQTDRETIIQLKK